MPLPAMNTAPMALCTLYLLLAAAMPRGAESGLTTSSIAAALSGPALSQGVQARSISGTIENSFLNSGMRADQGLFAGPGGSRVQAVLYRAGHLAGQHDLLRRHPVMVDAHMWLNTTVSLGRLYSCSSLKGGPAVCRTFYPRFDGSGQYCTIEATDPANYGYPLLRVGQVLNARVSIDTTWSDTDDLESHGINYYEPGNNAISGLYATYAPLDGGRPASMNCFFRLLRTCRGPLCFTETMIQ